jgi:hypothetical protein
MIAMPVTLAPPDIFYPILSNARIKLYSQSRGWNDTKRTGRPVKAGAPSESWKRGAGAWAACAVKAAGTAENNCCQGDTVLE